jgi:hypothetical protein
MPLFLNVSQLSVVYVASDVKTDSKYQVVQKVSGL